MTKGIIKEYPTGLININRARKKLDIIRYFLLFFFKPKINNEKKIRQREIYKLSLRIRLEYFHISGLPIANIPNIEKIFSFFIKLQHI